MLDLSIDIDAVADWLGLSLFELQVFFAWLALSLGFGLVAAAIYEVALWRSPVERVCRGEGADPFDYAFGDIPVVPMPAGSIINTDPALLAGGADQGSGGDGKHLSSGAAAARRPFGRARRAY